MDISRIAIGRSPPQDVNVIVEIPQGGVPVKYELDKDSGALMVDRFLHTAMYYPGNYGFIDGGDELAQNGIGAQQAVGQQQFGGVVQRFEQEGHRLV